jgi:hypothetical protein
MTKFRLKKEARQFFDEKYHKIIWPENTWKEQKFMLELLEPVERVYIECGHENRTEDQKIRSVSNSGWSRTGEHDGESRFHFTIKIQDVDYLDHERKINPTELMDMVQATVNDYIKRKGL